MQHTRVLLPLIRAAFAKTDHTLQDCVGVAVSEGPGSYTALRAGLSSAKGICMALEVPLMMISTLQSLAAAATAQRPSGTEHLVSALIARRQQLYAGEYAPDLQERVAPRAIETDALWRTSLASTPGVLIVGPDAEEIAQRFEQPVAALRVPLVAENLLAISQLKFANRDFANLDSAVPNYLKPPHITVAKPKF